MCGNFLDHVAQRTIGDDDLLRIRNVYVDVVTR